MDGIKVKYIRELLKTQVLKMTLASKTLARIGLIKVQVNEVYLVLVWFLLRYNKFSFVVYVLVEKYKDL